MLYRFFEDTLPSRFLKHLLRAEPIPRFKVIEKDDYLVEGACYLYQGMILKCQKAGYFQHLPGDALYPTNFLYPSAGAMAQAQPAVYPSSSATGYVFARYVVLKYYNSLDATVQYNYHSKQSWHDSDTHYHLGEYLRYLKYEKGINLLPYYNCFNYKSTLNLKIPAGKKCLLVPVKFNRTYTVALNSALPFKVKGILYNEFLGQYLETPVYKEYSNTSFGTPFTIETCDPVFPVENEETVVSAFHERDFHLLFELDGSNETGLVVLEGDYRYSNRDAITSCPHTSISTNLSLLRVDNGVSYAFSGRLLEYLLLHVVCEHDLVSDNIKRVQEQLVQLNIKQPYGKEGENIFWDYYEALNTGKSTYGLWDDELAAKLNIYINHLLSKGYPLVDQDGNVNSQLEEYLRRGVT